MPSPEKTLIHLQKIEKSFGNQRVLNIPEWKISEGIYWIQGENGAGKSTLFRIIAGMLPFSGDIHLDGTFDLRKHPVDYRLRVNLGEAEPLYPSFLTPADLVRFTAKTRKSSPGQPESLMGRLGITDYQDQPVGACSSGMIKKLSLALAFLGRPKLVILDEPLITIDRDAQDTLLSLIREHRGQGVSFLISSHQLFGTGEIALTQTFRLLNQNLIPIAGL